MSREDMELRNAAQVIQNSLMEALEEAQRDLNEEKPGIDAEKASALAVRWFAEAQGLALAEEEDTISSEDLDPEED